MKFNVHTDKYLLLLSVAFTLFFLIFSFTHNVPSMTFARVGDPSWAHERVQIVVDSPAT